MYWAWLAFLAALIVSGAMAYGEQLRSGLIVTAMRDQVKWFMSAITFRTTSAISGNAMMNTMNSAMIHMLRRARARCMMRKI